MSHLLPRQDPLASYALLYQDCAAPDSEGFEFWSIQTVATTVIANGGQIWSVAAQAPSGRSGSASSGAPRQP